MKAASGPKPDVRPSGNRGPWSGRAWCQARKEDMDNEQDEYEENEGCGVCEHNSAIRWWIAAIGLGLWACVGALGAIAWGVLR